MKIELDNKLAETFPFMKKKETLEEQQAKGRINNLYDAFGCDCSDGWYDVLYGLCSEITETYKKYNKPVDIVVDQIKEKYGTLRFYYHIEGRNAGINAIDLPGASLRLSSDSGDIYREVSGIVAKWEKKSGEVCEKCGNPGVLREDLSWILTLCDDCYSNIITKKK